MVHGGGGIGGFDVIVDSIFLRGDCEDVCCCACPSCWRDIHPGQICNHGLPKRARVCLITFWLFLIFGISGLVTAFGVYGTHTTDLSPTDMRPLTTGLGTTFCEGGSFTSDYQLDYYVSKETPKLAPTKVSYTLKRGTSVFPSKYAYWGFYLTAGSKVTVKSCVDLLASFYVIKESNWIDWQDYNCSCSELSRHTGDCKHKQKPDTFSYIAPETGEYYFVWANFFSQPTPVVVTFDLLRVPFDTHNTRKPCKNAFSCDVTNFTKDSQVIVYVPNLEYKESVYVTAQCSRKSGLFLAIFLCVPLMISLITGFLIYCISWCKKRPELPLLSPSSYVRLQSYV